MENTLVVVNPDEYGLEKTEAEKIQAVFLPMLDKMVELEKEYNEVIALPFDAEAVRRARELRLKYVKTRTGTGDIHKTAKAYYLAGGRFVDAWKNTQNFSALGKETELEKIEKHDEMIKEREREAVNEERQKQLSLYIQDVSFYNLKEMSEAGFNELLSNSKVAYLARKEAEEKAAAEIAAQAEREAQEKAQMKIENERLKAEAEEREKKIAEERAEQEKQLAAERAKAEAEARERKEAEKKERDAQAALLKAQEDKAREEAEARAKLEAEIQAQKDAEALKLRMEEEERKKAEAAPDKEKLKAYAQKILEIESPTMETPEGKQILNKALDLLGQVYYTLKQQ